MGNKSKRPGQGKHSELVVNVAASLPNALAVLVAAAGGALDISYSDLVASAENVNLQATPTETHLQLRTVLKPQVAGQVQEGPAGIPLLGGPVVLDPQAGNGQDALAAPEQPTTTDCAEPE